MYSTSESGLERYFDNDSFDPIAESPVSYITKARLRHTAAVPTHWVAIKSASTLRKFSKQPHDIVKELRLLRSLSHINIIELLGHTFERAMNTIHFWMPYISHILADILVCPVFSPHPLPCGTSPPSQPASFTVIVKSLIYQITRGLAYLHKCHIAHRDIKPRNILVTDQGCVKLIDFGIAWTDVTDTAVVQDDLWPEPLGEMCFDVSTGPYRAPELLFGATAYDAFATDIWSVGTTCAEFFTQLRLEKEYEDGRSDSDEEGRTDRAIVIPRALAGDPDAIWTRQSLFDCSRGSIGLAWSIFKIRGTPTERSWPDFKDLPDADKVTFQDVPPVNLQPLLPNLHTDAISIGDKDESYRNNRAVLDLLDHFLVYPPSLRLRPAEALNHPWFTEGLPLLLPEGYQQGDANDVGIVSWENKTLRDLLSVLPLSTST